MSTDRDPLKHYTTLANEAARTPKPIDVRGVIATVIADLRASGDTGMVENLLEAEAAIANLESKVAALIQAGKVFRNTVISTRGVNGMDNHDFALREAEKSLARIGSTP